MKFFSGNRDAECDIVSSIVRKDWDFSNDKHAVEFEMAMQNYYIEYIDNTYLTKSQRQTAIENFADLNIITDLYLPETFEGATLDQRNCVAYINRGKPKTIVAVSGGSWALSVCRGALEHQYSWMLNEFEEYNVISIVEDLSRSYTNPILYDSCLYKGINNKINSTQKLADYITTIMPNTEYHLVADCKNGHSTAMLAHYLKASRVLIQSGVTHCDYRRLLKQHNVEGKYELELWNQISFQLLFRQMEFCRGIPENLQSINSIARNHSVTPQLAGTKAMPECKFTYIHHENDLGFKDYIDLVDESIIEKIAIQTTPHTFGDHYITLELRQSGFFTEFFSDI